MRQTRKPTGKVPWPLVLLEGDEKSGKTWRVAQFTGSPNVGRCWWIDFAEGSGDEYINVPGASFEIIPHDGTFRDIYKAVEEAYDDARKDQTAGKKPAVLVLDGFNAEWDLLKTMAHHRARSSRKARAILAKDPNAVIDVSPNYWNEVGGMHGQLMGKLLTFPGIVLVTCRGKEVAKFEDGQPATNGQKDWRVEGHRSLGFDANAWVRVLRNGPAVLEAVRSVKHGLEHGGGPMRLPDKWDLEWLIFEHLGCTPANTETRGLVSLKTEMSPGEIAAEAIRSSTSSARILVLYRLAADLHYDGAVEENERGEEEPLPDLLKRIGRERKAAEQAAAAAQLDPDDSWAPAVDGITSPEDGETRLAELSTLLGKGEIDEPRYHQVRAAINSRIQAITGAPAGERQAAA